jgi:hypothetical protein
VDWLPFEHLLDHVYALAVSSMSGEEREAWDAWLWSDPKREAKILSQLRG